MRLTLKQAIRSVAPLWRLGAELFDASVRVEVWRILGEVEKENLKYEGLRAELIKRCGQVRQDEQAAPSAEGCAELASAINEVLATEVVIEGRMIAIGELESVAIPPDDAAELTWLICRGLGLEQGI